MPRVRVVCGGSSIERPMRVEVHTEMHSEWGWAVVVVDLCTTCLDDCVLMMWICERARRGCGCARECGLLREPSGS